MLTLRRLHKKVFGKAARSGYVQATKAYVRHYLEEVPWPSVLMLETSSWCNLKCPMCPRTIGKSPSGSDYGNMKLELLERLDTLFRHVNVVTLAWIGEPLINRELPGIVKSLKAYGVHVHITSNGLLLKRGVAEELVRAGLDGLAISIDAAEPELYRKIRVGGELEKVKANIGHLQQLKKELTSPTPHLEVAFVAMPENIHQLPDMIPLLDELDIHHLTVAPVDDFGLEKDFPTPNSGALGPKEEAKEAFNRTQVLARESNTLIGLIAASRFSWEIGEVPSSEAYHYRTDYSPAETEAIGLHKVCGVPWADVVIGDNGDVHPCCVSRRVMGNVNDTAFEQIWWGPKYREFRRRLLSTNPPAECRTCRRADWIPLRELDSLTGSIEVLKDEVLGHGWGAHNQIEEIGPDAFRHIGSQSTFFLDYRGEDSLMLELGTIEPVPTTGRVLVNELEVGSYQVQSWRERFDFTLPRLDRGIIKVTIISDAAIHRQIFHKGLLWNSKQNWSDRLRSLRPLSRLLQALASLRATGGKLASYE